ncbi:MAG TPA: hypothetical protein VJ839_07135 [Candidatus Limnocylindria bacterium]|nr:hypothetical protein [Candidatus Limnocylindria bacterium]
MKLTSKGLGPILIRGALRAFVAALYLACAFAIVPALSTGAESSAAADAGPMAEGVLAAMALMLITIGMAVRRWSSEETIA